ncbi:hypothetical protein VNI00_017129 [Paramarasmius palmivorus]|uniref:DUF6589 domain-containing protein n=1 Tax=Paramarasmius palmivorus TaxID=297713 RepID=A0AAW0B8N2_9AGAR
MSLPPSSPPPPTDVEDNEFDDETLTIDSDSEDGIKTPTGKKLWTHGQLVYADGSDPGVIWTDPITGDTPTHNHIIREKSTRKQLQTIASKHLPQPVTKAQHITLSMKGLSRHGINTYDVMDHIFNPKNKQGFFRYHGFFNRAGNLTNILNHFASRRNPESVRDELDAWAMKHVRSMMRKEARDITASGMLQSIKQPLNASTVLDFDLAHVFQVLKERTACVTTYILTGITKSRRRENDEEDREEVSDRDRRTQLVTASVILSCLGEYSIKNNFHKRIMGLYLYSTGSQRQQISVLSHVGITESYSNLIAKDTRSKSTREKDAVQERDSSTVAGESATQNGATVTTSADPTTKASLAPARVSGPRPGTLRQLSTSCRGVTRSVTSVGLYGTVWDNINMNYVNAEQIIGRHTTQENGTCATVWPLHKATAQDMELKSLVDSFDKAGPLTIDHILHTNQEASFFRKCLIYTILRIILQYGGEGFHKFADDLAQTAPKSPECIDLHQTPLYTLPAMDIDESTIVGNAEVDEAIVKELGIREHWWFAKWWRLICGDQLSVARLQSLASLRAGKEGGYSGFGWLVLMTGLFHVKIADMHGMFTAHWGKNNAGSNPGCLAFHNTQLHRLPISPTSLPTFRTCRDLVFTSLYARVLHCLLLVSGKASLEDYLKEDIDWTVLHGHACQIFDTYANSKTVEDLRNNRSEGVSKGDMIYENALLFMRDALISREFSDAIKAGDSGRVVLVLKTWALSFRANGRTKYAHEMLILIHNLSVVWPPAVKAIVLNNWLLNPTGRPNSWVEVDLVQEHFNFWIKSYYKAHGSNASWEWLGMIAPCVPVLRHLANMMKGALGVDVGTKHAPPNLTNDIEVLMKSLKENGVYQLDTNRKPLEDDDAPVVDTITTGLTSLTQTTSNPIDEYNRTFVRLQRRRRMTPVVGNPSTQAESSTQTTADEMIVETASSEGQQQPTTAEVDDNLPEEVHESDSDPDDLEDDVDYGEDDLEEEEDPTLERNSAKDVSMDMDNDWEGEEGLDIELLMLG